VLFLICAWTDAPLEQQLLPVPSSELCASESGVAVKRPCYPFKEQHHLKINQWSFICY